MGDAARAAGVGPEVEYKGRTLHFQPLRPKEVGRFEVWVEREVWASVFRHETWMPDQKYRELCEATRRDIGAKVYGAGEDRFKQVAMSAAGLKQIALISLQAGEKNVPQEDGAPAIDGELIDALLKAKPAEMRGVLIGIGWVQATEPTGDAH